MENRFLNFRNVATVLLIAIIAFAMLFNNDKNTVITKAIPAYIKNTDTVFVNVIQTKIVKVKDGTVVVDKAKYEEYVKEIDTIKKAEKFVDAIIIREYNNTVLDNDTATVKVYSKVQGALLSTSAELVIKEREQTVLIQNPRLSLIIGADIGYVNLKFTTLIKSGIQTRKGNIYSLSSDLNGNIFLGFSKSLVIFK